MKAINGMAYSAAEAIVFRYSELREAVEEVDEHDDSWAFLLDRTVFGMVAYVDFRPYVDGDYEMLAMSEDDEVLYQIRKPAPLRHPVAAG